MAGRRRSARGTRRTGGEGGAQRARGGGFLRWYRVVPLVALALVLAFCWSIVAAPSGITRQLVFPVRYAETISDSASRNGVDPLLVCAVIKCESDWDELAVSSAGAVGLMQVMPSTAQSLIDMGLVSAGSLDPDNLTDPETNIEFGCAYLGYLQRTLSTLDEVVAAYNAGPAVVQEWLSQGGSIPEGIEYAETRAYLERVTMAYEGYRDSYPEGIG